MQLASIMAGSEGHGLSEDQLFELVVCAAIGQAVRQYASAHAALVATRLLPGYYDLDEQSLRDRWTAGESLARITRVEDKPWGMREFALADVDNNLLRIGAPLKR